MSGVFSPVRVVSAVRGCLGWGSVGGFAIKLGREADADTLPPSSVLFPRPSLMKAMVSMSSHSRLRSRSHSHLRSQSQSLLGGQVPDLRSRGGEMPMMAVSQPGTVPLPAPRMRLRMSVAMSGPVMIMPVILQTPAMMPVTMTMPMALAVPVPLPMSMRMPGTMRGHGERRERSELRLMPGQRQRRGQRLGSGQGSHDETGFTRREGEVREGWSLTTRVIFFLLQIGLILALSACVPNRPYWVSKKTGDGKPWAESSRLLTPLDAQHQEAQRVAGWRPERAPQIPPLRVVEFDDQGDLWTRSESEDAVKMIAGMPRDSVTVLFIHGWKNNAAATNDDFQSFQRLLADLERKGGLKRRVCGIYVGWRGDVLGPAADWSGIGFLPRQATIYNRIGAADRIANGLPFTQFLSHVSQTAMARGKCVMIGHSLGGRILETTMTRSLVDKVAEVSASSGTRMQMKKPADLILLINPASDGQRARQAQTGVRWAELSDKVTAADGQRYHVPLVVSMKSETDMATGWIYTVAMNLGKLGRKTRMYPAAPGYVDSSQKRYITQTAGTLDNMVTHRAHADRALDATLPAPVPGTRDDAFAYNMKFGTLDRFALTHGSKESRWWGLSKDHHVSNTPNGKGFKIYEPDAGRERGSYWVVQVPKQILNGHSGDAKDNGIFSPVMTDFFAALYSMTQPRRENAMPESVMGGEGE